MRKSLALPSEDAEAEMAELVACCLTAAGYEHYEISNYAHDGKRSRHNMRYWLGEDYLGFGPGAHSFLNGVRFYTAPSTADYIDAVEREQFSALRQEPHRVAGKELQDEYVMLRMRLFEGLSMADFAHRFGTSFAEAYGDVSKLVAAGLLWKNEERIAFTERGMRVSNAILSDWLDFGAEGEEE
jgi:oxygen-independent coproporphyrinogen-3 oxidase